MVALALIVALVSVAWFVLAVIVPFVTKPAMIARLGRFRAGLLGVVICGLLAVVGFLLLNPDHIATGDDPRARFWDAAQLAGASAIFWMPVYLFGLSRRLKRGRAT